MFIEYFTDTPKYTFNCIYRKKSKFKHGVQIDLWANDASMEISIDDFIFPFFAWMIEIYSYDPKRYEVLFDTESDTAFALFRDKEDLVAFKIIWGENPSEWDEKHECYVSEGIRVDSILHI